MAQVYLLAMGHALKTKQHVLPLLQIGEMVGKIEPTEVLVLSFKLARESHFLEHDGARFATQQCRRLNNSFAAVHSLISRP
jgi:hypothetical protein